jgi:peroxiredoxin Q/BCP
MPKIPELKLQVGDPAPDFTAMANGGTEIRLSELRGKSVILYFYPRDDTPGCTKEACAFREAFPNFQARDAVVLGVSTDSAQSHDRFVKKFRLPFMLVADPEHEIVRAYGVWGQKSFFGHKFQGTYRVTFLIGPDGRIQAVWPAVKPARHAREVLAALEQADSSGDDI